MKGLPNARTAADMLIIALGLLVVFHVLVMAGARGASSSLAWLAPCESARGSCSHTSR